MAQTLNIYNQFLNTLTNKEIDLNSDELKVMLVSSAYVPSKETHKYKTDITNESSGSGYISGGSVLQNVTYTLNGTIGTLKASNVRWEGLDVDDIRYAVIYDNTPSDSKALIAYIDFGDTLSVVNTELEIVWNTEGIIKFSLF